MTAPLVRFALAGLLAVAIVGAAAVALQRDAARDDAVDDAETVARLAGAAIVQPNVTPKLLAGDVTAIDRLDAVVRDKILPQDGIARVKVWRGDGEIVYSDLRSLIGTRFALSEEDREALTSPRPKAELTTLHRAENRFDELHGRLLEVYMPMKATNGEPVLFELYQRQSALEGDVKRTWLAFVPALIGALLLLQGLQLPLARRMARSLQDHRRDREDLLLRAIDASDRERRKIAGDIHDGVVQDLAGTSYILAAAAKQVDRDTAGEAADALHEAADKTRRAIRQLRSLLVDIYPPDLRRAGLPSALSDLVASVESRGVRTSLTLPDRGFSLSDGGEVLLFRAAQEALRNVLTHSAATSVAVTLAVDDRAAQLTIDDDGAGFRPEDVLDAPIQGHIGLRVLADMAQDAGGELAVDSQPGGGTRVFLEVPLGASTLESLPMRRR